MTEDHRSLWSLGHFGSSHLLSTLSCFPPSFPGASATMVAALGKQASCMPVSERQGRRHVFTVETAIINEGVSLTILSGLVSRTCLSR